MPESAVAEGPGQIQCLYLVLGLQANIAEVAADVTNQGPTILLVCCDSEEMATQMLRALEKDAVNNDIRGDAGKGQGKPPRLDVDKLQVKYSCLYRRGLIFAGRKGIVANITLHQTVFMPEQRPLVMTEFSFAV